ncbi:MAG: trypsin-like peptidase domain-containing protein [Dehalogenimonas sp.]|uniref:Trypsin-like peptidase domain-containing protein n=1 Tax=Candidatus Dehalogenimonas loeffleri TaxID=3127115 RepID=A0ABZ2J3G3_9CHLR|nr:trypsin-like peptidase domain-containing protein [Dehalogenimonas sp.]
MANIALYGLDSPKLGQEAKRMSTGFRNFMIAALVVLLGLSGFSSYTATQTRSDLQDAQDDITSLTSQLSTAQSTINSLQNQVGENNEDIASIIARNNAVETAAAKALPSMVYIETPYGSGSGVIMDAVNGYILTNKHVVEGATEARVITQDRKIYDVVNIWQDSLMDLAVVEIDANGLTAAEFGNTSNLRVGDTIVALGNPLGYSPADYGSTVTAGIVSNLLSYWYFSADYWYPDLIQYDVFITNGNSGGPLINLDGEVIGINSLGEEAGINYAINVATAERVYNNLITSHQSIHPYLGVDVWDYEQPVPGDPFATQLLGAEVFDVVIGSPADGIGLEIGDVILSANGQTIGLSIEFIRLLWRLNVGDTLTLTGQRDTTELNLTVVLGERPATAEPYIF